MEPLTYRVCHYFEILIEIIEVKVTLGFVYRFAAVYGFGKPGKSAAAAAVTLTTQGEMCTTKTKKPFGNNS